MRPNRLHTPAVECGEGGNGVWMWMWCVSPLVVVCATTVLVCATPVLVCATPTLGCVAYLRSGNFRCHTPDTQRHTPQHASHTPFFLVCHLFFGVPPAFWLEIINVHFKEDSLRTAPGTATSDASCCPAAGPKPSPQKGTERATGCTRNTRPRPSTSGGGTPCRAPRRCCMATR